MAARASGPGCTGSRPTPAWTPCGVAGGGFPGCPRSPRPPGPSPHPDRLLDELAPSGTRPDAVVVARETIELTFLAVIQLLPPRQRAVLILRDMLDWSAAGAPGGLVRVGADRGGMPPGGLRRRPRMRRRRRRGRTGPRRPPNHHAAAPLVLRRAGRDPAAAARGPLRPRASGVSSPPEPTASPQPPATSAPPAAPGSGRSSSTSSPRGRPHRRDHHLRHQPVPAFALTPTL